MKYLESCNAIICRLFTRCIHFVICLLSIVCSAIIGIYRSFCVSALVLHRMSCYLRCCDIHEKLYSGILCQTIRHFPFWSFTYGFVSRLSPTLILQSSCSTRFFNVLVLFILSIGSLMTTTHASGFRLPEQSLNGTALNSAFIAGAYGADSTYYNPANMGLGRDSDKYEFELDGTLIIIPGFDFITGNRNNYDCAKYNNCSTQVSGSAVTTVQPVPKFFFKSRAYELPLGLRMNYGASFTTPSGLSMNWNGEGGGFLDDVSIAMLELNPVISLAWKDYIAIGGGFRAIYTFGTFNNTLYVPYDFIIQGISVANQTSNASAWGFGYNLAMTLKPLAWIDNSYAKGFAIAATFRSNVHWDMRGRLSASAFQDLGSNPITGGIINVNMDGNLQLSADLPPILNIAISQDIGNFRLEFVYERTFYGSADIFEFVRSGLTASNCSGTGLGGMLGCSTIDSTLDAADYSAVAYGNGWKDASAYRLGLTYFGKSYTLMGSVAYDETPAPQGQFGIPDANAYMIGFGARKRFFNDKLDIGIAYSLALKDNRKSFIVSQDGFGQLHLITIGAKLLW